jgi:hypothetical protein
LKEAKQIVIVATWADGRWLPLRPELAHIVTVPQLASWPVRQFAKVDRGRPFH